MTDHERQHADPDHCFEEFWARLVNDETGNLDPAKVKAELYDYHFMMGNTAAAFDAVTGGLISKPNTLAFEVEAAVGERLEQRYAEGREDAIEEREESEIVSDLLDTLSYYAEPRNLDPEFLRGNDVYDGQGTGTRARAAIAKATRNVESAQP